MDIALFIPCYIDQFYPRVGIATVELLERLGCTVHFPEQQTCCGQPLANSGSAVTAEQITSRFTDLFNPFQYIVAPSGSCVHHIRHQLPDQELANRTFELSQFITDVLKLDQVKAHFPKKVGLHNSCHGLRGLRLAASSELNVEPYNKTRQLLQSVDGIELINIHRGDECCGFGGTFAVTEEAVSVKMGNDRLKDHLDNGVEVITGTDMSCLMHLEGLVRRQGLPVTIMHTAEILNYAPA